MRPLHCTLGPSPHQMRLLVNTLTHNNRIINNNTQHQQEGEGAENI